MKKDYIVRAMRLAMAMAAANKRPTWLAILDAMLTVLYLTGFFFAFSYIIYKAWQTVT